MWIVLAVVFDGRSPDVQVIPIGMVTYHAISEETHGDVQRIFEEIAEQHQRPFPCRLH